jgi:hypothetical protein
MRRSVCMLFITSYAQTILVLGPTTNIYSKSNWCSNTLQLINFVTNVSISHCSTLLLDYKILVSKKLFLILTMDNLNLPLAHFKT